MFSFNSRYATAPHELPELDETIFDRSPRSESRLYHGVPKLMVAIDTETTGLADHARPISYGIAVYRHGIEQPDEHHHYLADHNELESPMHPEAFKTHGISDAQLRDSYNGNITRDTHGNIFNPALHRHGGIAKTMKVLAHYQKQGAVFLNHNLLDYDFPIIQAAHDDAYGGLDPTGFDFDKARKRSIDTLHHARLRQEGPIKRGKRLSNLTALCLDQGINPGNHTALEDAKASANLFFNQVRNNIKENRPSMQKMASTGEAGIDYKKISPFCTGKNCQSCTHIDRADAANRDKMGKTINKRHDEIINNVRILHHNVEGLKKGK